MCTGQAHHACLRPATFLQLLHHLDLEVARAAVPSPVARSPGLALNAVPDALADGLEALGRGTRHRQETGHGASIVPGGRLGRSLQPPASETP